MTDTWFTSNEYPWSRQQVTPAVQGAVELARTKLQKAMDALRLFSQTVLDGDTVLRIWVGGENPPPLAASGDLWWSAQRLRYEASFGADTRTNLFTQQSPLEDMPDHHVLNGSMATYLQAEDSSAPEIRYVKTSSGEFRFGFWVRGSGTRSFTFSLRSTQVSALRSFRMRTQGSDKDIDDFVVLEETDQWMTVRRTVSGGDVLVFLNPASDANDQPGDTVFIKEILVEEGDNHLEYFNGWDPACSWQGVPGRSASVYTPQWHPAPGLADINPVITEEGYEDGFIDVYLQPTSPIFPGVGDLWLTPLSLSRWDGLSWVRLVDDGKSAIEDDLENISDVPRPVQSPLSPGPFDVMPHSTRWEQVNHHNRVIGVWVQTQEPEGAQWLNLDLDLSLLGTSGGALDEAVVSKLWADVVRSRRITTDMLLVGSGDNLVVDPGFMDSYLNTARSTFSDLRWDVSTGVAMLMPVSTNQYLWAISAPSGGSGTGPEHFFPVTGGQVYRIRYQRRSQGSGTASTRPVIRWTVDGLNYSTSIPRGTMVTAGASWEWDEVEYTAPAAAKGMYMGVQGTTQSGTSLFVQSPQVINKLDPALLVDGDIRARLNIRADGELLVGIDSNPHVTVGDGQVIAWAPTEDGRRPVVSMGAGATTFHVYDPVTDTVLGGWDADGSLEATEARVGSLLLDGDDISETMSSLPRIVTLESHAPATPLYNGNFGYYEFTIPETIKPNTMYEIQAQGKVSGSGALAVIHLAARTSQDGSLPPAPLVTHGPPSATGIINDSYNINLSSGGWVSTPPLHWYYRTGLSNVRLRVLLYCIPNPSGGTSNTARLTNWTFIVRELGHSMGDPIGQPSLGGGGNVGSPTPPPSAPPAVTQRHGAYLGQGTSTGNNWTDYVGSTNIVVGPYLNQLTVGRRSAGLSTSFVHIPANMRNTIVSSQELVSARVRLAPAETPRSSWAPTFGTSTQASLATRPPVRNVNPGSRSYGGAGWSNLTGNTLASLKAGDPVLAIGYPSDRPYLRFHGPTAANSLRPRLEVVVRSRT